MANELIINASLPETRIALLEDGEIQDLLIERSHAQGIVGNIYKGKVTRVLPGMQAAFVDIGLEKAAFLYVDDVIVHSQTFEDEVPEGDGADARGDDDASGAEGAVIGAAAGNATEQAVSAAPIDGTTGEEISAEDAAAEEFEARSERGLDDDADSDESPEEGELDSEDDEPVGMGPDDGTDGGDEGGSGSDGVGAPEGTIAPGSEGGPEEGATAAGEVGAAGDAKRRRGRRGRRGGRFRKDRKPGNPEPVQASTGGGITERITIGGSSAPDAPILPDQMTAQLDDAGATLSDRSSVGGEDAPEMVGSGGDRTADARKEFKETRSRDRRIRTKPSARAARAPVNIQDLLKEGDEVLVQVAKDPIATKGARLTCHISLAGRHLVCMPTIDHIGVSRRIERDDERRRLREYVDKYRPKKLGFIVRTASGKQSEKRIETDIQYLSRLWEEIRTKAGEVHAPALVYQDLNPVLRSIRDWVNEDIDKIVVDSRYHYNEVLQFTAQLMPQLRSKVELYQGDIPIFDAYGIAAELARAMERKVWLKSGGYLVIDQAEALVAIDVNTGRYVGKKSLEDTILKTNLEAVQEIAYQLRLRNCGGIIILDLIDMERDENKQRVYRALEEALKKDRARPTILKISELGLVEMTRKRTRDTIVRALCESCTHCEGKGFIKTKQTVAYEVLREMERSSLDRESTKILVQAHQDVIDVLAIEERDTVEQMERRLKKQVYLQAVVDFHPEQFEVVGDRKPRKDAGAAFNDRLDRNHRGERRARGGRSRDKGRDRERSGGGGGGGKERRPEGIRPEIRPENRMDASEEVAPRPGQSRITLPLNPVPPAPIQSVSPVSIGAPATDEDRQPNFGGPVPRPSVQPRQWSEEDEDRQPDFGNGGHPTAFNYGNESYSEGVQAGPQTAGVGADQDFENEEDRQAFLRAQAAQDQALARGISNNPALNPRAGSGSGGGRPNNNNRSGRGRRGGRGGRGGAAGGRGPAGGNGAGGGARGGFSGQGRAGSYGGGDGGFASRSPAPVGGISVSAPAPVVIPRSGPGTGSSDTE